MAAIDNKKPEDDMANKGADAEGTESKVAKVAETEQSESDVESLRQQLAQSEKRAAQSEMRAALSEKRAAQSEKDAAFYKEQYEQLHGKRSAEKAQLNTLKHFFGMCASMTNRLPSRVSLIRTRRAEPLGTSSPPRNLVTAF